MDKSFDYTEAAMSKVRTFDTGANRDTDENKLDYEAFLSPLVLERYAEYLHEHRKLPDGTMREGDNWQKGMPLIEYMKSGWRHFKDWWTIHRGWPVKTGKMETQEKVLQDALCGLIFNASGYLHEVLKAKLVEQNVGIENWRDAGRPVAIPPMRHQEYPLIDD